MNRPILSFVIALLLISGARQVQAQNYTYLGTYTSSGKPNYLVTPVLS